MINVEIISTGSKGNAVLLDGQVLVDCGVPFRKLEECGVVDKIKFIFLTHQHIDHLNVATIRKLISVHPSIRLFYNGYLKKPLYDFFIHFEHSFLYKNSFITDEHKWYKIGNIKFSNVPLHHDVPNCGWKIHFCTPQGIYKIFYATDTSNLNDISVKSYDLYLIEANYENKALLQRIKEKRATGQFVYEDRVIKTHMSKEQTDEWLYNNMGSNSSFVYMHKHEDLI